MPSLIDGTPYVAIGNDEPESKKFLVHKRCPECGKEHYFNLWDMMAGKEITCEHCGHKSLAKTEEAIGLA